MAVTTFERTAAVERFVELRRSASDLQRSAAFYGDGLGFEVADRAPGEIVLTLGAQRIVLVSGAADAVRAVSGPDLRFQHIAIVAADMRAAFARLQALAPVAISRGGPQQLPAASGGVCAYKFRDPDGHALELIEFPPGQGASCWHPDGRVAAGPTLGIDHAAISVANVERSIAFYEQLGFAVQTRQFNHGAEQARLDGLDVADVDVVALSPLHAGTPHLELLAYRRPAPCCGGPLDPATADRLIWQVAAQHDPAREPPRAAADPDGHLLEFIA